MRRKPITFNDCHKTFTKDQDKAITPEQTVECFFNRVGKLDVNIISEVRRIDTGRLDIPVYFSVCTDEAQALTGTRKQMGKGASPAQAKASACMELAERYSFFSFRNNQDKFIRGDFGSLRKQGYPLLGPDWLLKSVDDTRLKTEHLEQVLEDVPLFWTWATNLATGESVLIPFSWFYAINEFNGPSAGNTFEEAALQGLCEVVERHVCSLISHNCLPTPRIDTQTIVDQVARQLIDKFERNGIELYLYDFSLDTGIPTVGALAIDRTTFPSKSEIVYTAGTATNPEKAIIRAVTEVAQLAGDFNTSANYVASGLPKPSAMEDVAYLAASQQMIAVNEMNDVSHSNMRVEIINCRNALEKIGLDVFMVDVTHEQLGIPALYTIIPGAHFRERSIRRDAGLFAAKLITQLIDEQPVVEQRLKQMEAVLPEAYYLWFYRGIGALERNDPELAVTHFSKALGMQPEVEDLPYIYSYQGQAFQMLQRYEEAIATLKNGVEEDENRPDLHNSLGVCHYKRGEYQQAIYHFERAIQLNPASAIDYANLGLNKRLIGDFEAAIEAFTVALTLDPSIEFAREQLANLSTAAPIPED